MLRTRGTVANSNIVSIVTSPAQCFGTALLFLALEKFAEDEAHNADQSSAARFLAWLR